MLTNTIADRVIAQVQEVSLTGQINAYLALLNKLVMGEALDWLKQNPDNVLLLIELLDKQALFIPNSFRIETSKCFWNCEKPIHSHQHDIVFYQTSGESEDDTFISRPIGRRDLAEKLFAELYRKDGRIAFLWEPFGSSKRAARYDELDEVTTES